MEVPWPVITLRYSSAGSSAEYFCPDRAWPAMLPRPRELRRCAERRPQAPGRQGCDEVVGHAGATLETPARRATQVRGEAARSPGLAALAVSRGVGRPADGRDDEVRR